MVRFHGHFEGDAQTYRGKGELDDIRANKDCIKKFSAAVTGAGVLTAAELQAIDHEVLGLIEQAVVQAKAAPAPTLAALTTDVYVKY
jgi:pyruvate dehydrogenase E1 component alpha subunit